MIITNVWKIVHCTLSGGAFRHRRASRQTTSRRDEIVRHLLAVFRQQRQNANLRLEDWFQSKKTYLLKILVIGRFENSQKPNNVPKVNSHSAIANCLNYHVNVKLLYLIEFTFRPIVIRYLIILITNKMMCNLHVLIYISSSIIIYYLHIPLFWFWQYMDMVPTPILLTHLVSRYTGQIVE